MAVKVFFAQSEYQFSKSGVSTIGGAVGDGVEPVVGVGRLAGEIEILGTDKKTALAEAGGNDFGAGVGVGVFVGEGVALGAEVLEAASTAWLLWLCITVVFRPLTAYTFTTTTASTSTAIPAIAPMRL